VTRDNSRHQRPTHAITGTPDPDIFVGKETKMTTMSRHQQPTERLRSLLGVVGGIVMIAAALVACSGSSKGPVSAATPTSAAPATATSAAPATTPTMLATLPALGDELPASQIPWSQVGPGWILATWSPAPGLGRDQTPPAGQPKQAEAPRTLYLLDPAGGRYAITTFPKDPPTLVDWSGDGRHALFEDNDYDPNTQTTTTTITEVDLPTSANQTFTVDGLAQGTYSRPTGQAILLSTSYAGKRPTTVQRVDLSGTEQLTFPTDLGAAGTLDGNYLETPDGKQLVFGTANGMVVVGNDGAVGRQLPMPGPLTECSPVRWWTPTVILASCAKYPSAQLWQVPLDGGAPTVLTAVNTAPEDPAYDQDVGDEDAWQLPSGTFLQSRHQIGASCGWGYLSRLTPDLHTTAVTVPGAEIGVLVTGATADKLVLRATMGCGGITSLLTYDPAANTSTVLLGPPVNGGAVIDAIVYPG
jgi:TolB protein